MIYQKQEKLHQTEYSPAVAMELIQRVAAARTARRILLLTQFFAPDYAATGQLLEELVKQLSRLGLGIDVFTGQLGYAFSEQAAPAKERRGNVKIRRSRVSQLGPQRIRGKAVAGVLYMLRAIFHTLRHGWRNRVLLLTTAPPFLPMLGYFANVLLGIPYICILYDLYPDIAVELEVLPAQHPVARVWRGLNRLVWQRAAALIVLSPAMKDQVVGHCPAVADRVTVIHSWADPQQVTPIPKADNWFARQHGLVEPFTVLYSGNMGRCHDVDTIFAAAQLLRDEPIRFVCIGGGAKRAPLMAKVEHAGLNNFLFLPYQAKADLPYSLTACDLSLVSVDAGMESLVAPSKLYPALSAGRPIAAICSEGTYLEALLKAGGCGASFRNGDARSLADFIRQLANDHSLAEQMGQSGRQYLLAHFTPEIIGQEYFKLLQAFV